MKKILFVALALPLLSLVAGAEGCGDNSCTSDADCAGKTNSVGDDTPFCDVEAAVCVPDQGECVDDLDCQLINPDSATTEEACASNSDCGAGDERCVENGAGITVCALVGDQTACAAVDTDSVSVTDIDGGAADVCLAGGTCGADGGCDF